MHNPKDDANGVDHIASKGWLCTRHNRPSDTDSQVQTNRQVQTVGYRQTVSNRQSCTDRQTGTDNQVQIDRQSGMFSKKHGDWHDAIPTDTMQM